jgi:hypothetical protein
MGFLDVFRRNHRDRDSRASGPATSEIELLIPNWSAKGAPKSLTRRSRRFPGVRQTRADVRRKSIRVRYEPEKVHPGHLKDAAIAADFTAVEARMPVGRTDVS